MHPGDRHYRNMALRVADLAVTDQIVRSVTFENCILIGPAVIALLGNASVSGCRLEGDLDAVIWEVPAARHTLIGAIGFQDCALVGCELKLLGFAVPTPQIEAFRAGFGG